MDFRLYQHRDRIQIKLQSARPLTFYYMWLRDHCRCSQCYDVETNQKSSCILNIPMDIKPSKIGIIKDELHITWEDEHETVFQLPWLYSIEFPLTSKKKMIMWNKHAVSTFQDLKIPYKIYCKDENGTKLLLQSILKYGFAFVTGVEPTVKATQLVLEKVAPSHKTYFGEMWTVTNNNQIKDSSCCTVGLKAHNDNTYFTEAAGIQVFHMLVRKGTGGETILVDGFNAAKSLKEKSPEDFEALCNNSIGAHYIDKGCYYTNMESIIKLHPVTKELHQIRYNIYDRSTLNTVPSKKILDFYKAYKAFGNEIYDPINEYQVQLEPGSVLFIDNFRVLHGRNAYEGERLICGSYISRADWLSTAKLLRCDIV